MLNIELMLPLARERIINVLRVWLKNNAIQLPASLTFHRLIDELIGARPDAAPEVGWAEIVIRRYRNCLYWERRNTFGVPERLRWPEFPAALVVQEAGISLQAQKAKQGLVIPAGAEITVRFRQGGELFVWHGQSKRLKKLFQQWGVPPWLRERVPLVYVNDTLAAVAGYAISDLFFSKDSEQAYVLI